MVPASSVSETSAAVSENLQATVPAAAQMIPRVGVKVAVASGVMATAPDAGPSQAVELFEIGFAAAMWLSLRGQILTPADFSRDSAPRMTLAHSCFVFGSDFLDGADLRLAGGFTGFFIVAPQKIDPAFYPCTVDGRLRPGAVLSGRG